MDNTEKKLVILVLALLIATFAVSSIPKTEMVITPIPQPSTAEITKAPVIIKPGATASVMVLNNGAKATVEVK